MSSQLAKPLVEILIQKRRESLEEMPEIVTRKNYELTKATGFFFMGVYYGARRIKGQPVGLLHLSLYSEMYEYLRQVKDLNFDNLRMEQALTLVLKDTHSAQDVRDALPEVFSEYLGDASKLKRTRPEAYTLARGTMASRQYEAIRPRIDFYFALRFLI